MSTKQLAELIGQKRNVLVQLQQLGRQQAGLVRAENINNLLVLLSVKQTLLSQLQTIEKRLEPFRSQDPEARTWVTPADRQRCAEVARQCEELLAEIVRVERQSEEEMQRRRDAAAARLEETGTAAEARRAYAQPARPVAGQLNLYSGAGP